MTRALIAAAAILAAGQAHAFCSSGYSSTWEGKVADEFERLICLHNEQSTSLNQHADMFNRHARDINAAYDALEAFETILTDQANQIDRLEARISELESAQ